MCSQSATEQTHSFEWRPSWITGAWAPTFKSMEEDASTLKLETKHVNTDVSPAKDSKSEETERRQSSTSENDSNTSSLSPNITEVRIVAVNETSPDKPSAEINEVISEKTRSCVKTKNEGDVAEDLSEIHHKFSENKENDPKSHDYLSLDCNKGTLHTLDERNEDADREIVETKSSGEDLDTEILRGAQDEGCMSVVFPGTVTQDGCCRFVSEILKCVLYQRQQLPMTYDQLVYSQKKLQAQDKDTVKRRPAQGADMDWRKCQQTLQELEEVLQHLEVLFSLSRVPKVLLLMGGTLLLPKEFYEINMEALVLASGEKSLRVSSCLRQIFRNLFVADFLSDTKPVRLIPTTVMVLAHRDCGVDWFRPKQQFKVPTRVKSKVMALSTDLCSCKDLQRDELDSNDYIWFQAPMTIKGFSNRKA